MIHREETVLQDWDLTQIINGKEIMSPSPKSYHQKISKRIHRILDGYVEKENLGEIYNAPLDVILEEDINRVQPDLIFISKENADIVKDWIRGVPDLLVEIVSKSSFHLDTIEKKELYEKYSVKEYWIVLPEYATVEIYSLDGNQYKLFSTATDDQVVKSKLLNGLSFSVAPLFE
ncbi:Endonuclease, Uma2 family (restriction endonuclease fold) [Dyadobacter koreensis]|uniref:Endonuclease, Uma2 family (Restriction endonuclease fold) n=1 Tax=Dyadobacter koreensis TaxID=408657 RepID=A0A1H6S4K6_9BACT|nr:Uma2 family endonuclease [Dyadobacter koreensis]SEI62993.1 Endonuclease, Uma2 family (restriction endonuclease fold) [Dyadobacter koreensis]